MAIGFPPRYDSEIDISHLTESRAHILVQETLGAIGWKIAEVKSFTTVAHTNPIDGEFDEIITFTIEGVNLNIESKSVKNKFMDFGANKKNFETFADKFEETTLLFEGKDLVDLSHTYNQINMDLTEEDPSETIEE